MEVEQLTPITAPIALKKAHEHSIHGHTRLDPYYWMRERENPDVKAYLEEENAYVEAVMQHTKPLQEKLYDEIVGRIKKTDMSVPYFLKGYHYYTRHEEGKEYPIHCRKKGTLDATEEVIIDVNEFAVDKPFCHVMGLSVSEDNNLVAFSLDTIGRRQYTIYIKNLETGELLDDVINNTTGGTTWSSDNNYLFYSVQDETLRSHKIFRHQLGTKDTEDIEVFHETDDTYRTFIYKSKSDRYLIIISASTVSTEYRVLDANNPTGEFKIIHPRERDLEYSIAHYGEYFYLITNYEAKNFRLMKTPINQTSKENWTEVIAHREDVFLEDIELFQDYLVLEERHNGLLELRILSWDGKTDYYLEFDEPAYTAYAHYNPEFDTKELRFAYMSMKTPNSIYQFQMDTKEKNLLKQQEVLGDFDSDKYEVERLYATVTDGTKVPISLVYRKGLKKDSKNPLLLYGYGSYGASMDVHFSSARLSLIDRGFIFAIAHIRGGEEMGRKWYEDGKLLKKKNTFQDFIDCGKYLINEKYTSPAYLFGEGGSAGGLLIGAVINMRPDLFNAVVAAVPFVDVVTTMLDDKIPLTTGEYDEWGNPNNKTFYDYILSYSPYDNVEAKDYPAMLVTTGFHDSQVQYWEPAKWVAKLRELKTDNQPLLFQTDMSSGHGGASGRFSRHKLTALEFAFLLDRANITS